MVGCIMKLRGEWIHPECRNADFIRWVGAVLNPFNKIGISALLPVFSSYLL